MGLLLYIKKEDIEDSPMGEIIDEDVNLGTFATILGADVWDCHLNAKRMIEWALTKHGRVHVKITKTPVTGFGGLELNYEVPLGTVMDDSLNPNAGLGTTRYINEAHATVNLSTGNITGNWSGTEHWPEDTPMPGDPEHDAPFGPQGWGPVSSIITTSRITSDEAAILAATTVRDDEIEDYERLMPNFKSLCCEVTRNEADPGFNKSDAHAQAVSGTFYHQSLYLFPEGFGLTGLYFGHGRHDFRILEIAPLTLFGVLVDTGDENLTDPFQWPSFITQTYTDPSPTTDYIEYPWTDPNGIDSIAKISYGVGSYKLDLVTFTEHFV